MKAPFKWPPPPPPPKRPEPLTPHEVYRLPDKAEVRVLWPGNDRPYTCVVRWEREGRSDATPCLCTFNPATMENDLVITRLHPGRIDRYKIWKVEEKT